MSSYLDKLPKDISINCIMSMMAQPPLDDWAQRLFEWTSPRFHIPGTFHYMFMQCSVTQLNRAIAESFVRTVRDEGGDVFSAGCRYILYGWKV